MVLVGALELGSIVPKENYFSLHHFCQYNKPEMVAGWKKPSYEHAQIRIVIELSPLG